MRSQVSSLGNQRTFTYLARLSPGVLPAENGARDSLGGGFSANGVRSTGENNFLLNGVDNNVNVIDFINQTSFVIGPSLEAIGDMHSHHQRQQCGIRSRRWWRGRRQPENRARTRFTAWSSKFCRTPMLNANRWENNLLGRAGSDPQAEPVWRSRRRTDHQEQVIHFWRLSRHAYRYSRRCDSESRLWRPY